MQRQKTDLRDPKSFDHVGRDAGANQFTFGKVLADLGDEHPQIVGACADLKWVTHMSDFEGRHPERFFQFGISERTMYSAAAGLATCGLIPYAVTFASFSAILAYEVIRTDMAYPRLPVRVLGTHCGISLGFFGTSHHATEDIAALRAVAGLKVLSASDNDSLAALLRETVLDPEPIYFRIGRGAEGPVYDGVTPEGYGSGLSHVVASTGEDLLIVSTGIQVRFCMDALDALKEQGVGATIVDAYSLKPFDGDGVAELAGRHRAVLVVEEHNVEGGLGTIVQEALMERGLAPPVYKHGLYDEFGIVGPPSHLYRYYGLDGSGVASVAERLIRTGARPASRSLWTSDDRKRVMDEVSSAASRRSLAASVGTPS